MKTNRTERIRFNILVATLVIILTALVTAIGPHGPF
jgi:hypothetical protein